MTTPNEPNQPQQTNTPGHMKEEGKARASELSAAARDKAQQQADEVKQRAQDTLDQNRGRAGEEMQKVAHAAQAAAQDLRDQDRENLSAYVEDMAQSINSLAEGMRSKNMDELIHDVTSLAKRNPALFVTGSLAIGFGLSRFAKSSSHRMQDSQQSDETQDTAQADSQDYLYPGYSDAEPESRGAVPEGRGYGDAAKSFGDSVTQPTTQQPGGTAQSETADNMRGKRYE